ncbi:MAG TPA: cupin domain-containing protein [Rubrobacter sp.]|nr:cupin domain-containing protein [Rubrobacter sp.]
MPPDKNPFLIAPDDGVRLPVLDITHKVTAAASGGSLVVDEWCLAPGQTIPPHTHLREDECSYVLEGELTCYVGGEVVRADAGSYIVKPRRVPHAFHNAGARTVRVMEILTPGWSFEGYFDRYEEIASRSTSVGDHETARAELSKGYDITWHDDMVSEVKARFGIGP